MKNKKIFSLILACSISIFFALSTPTYADVSPWESGHANDGGGGSSGGGGGGGGGGNSNCDEGQFGQLDCTGASWIFYKHVDGAPIADTKFPAEFPTGLPDSTQLTIPKTCASGKDAGFWHYGRNVKSTGSTLGFAYHNRPSPWAKLSDGTFSRYLYETSKGSWGHFTTSTVDSIRNSLPTQQKSWWDQHQGSQHQTTFNGESMVGQLFHVIYNENGAAMYSADRYAEFASGSSGTSYNNVLKAFKEMRRYSGGNTSVTNLNNISAFCWNADMSSGGRYNGAITISVNGQVAHDGDTINVGNREYSDVTFDHQIRRNNTNYGGQTNNTWRVNGSNGNFNGVSSFQKSQEGQLLSVKKAPKQWQLGPGESKTVCTKLIYNDDFDNNGNGTGEAQVGACVTITRTKNNTGGDFVADQTCHLEAGGHSKDGCWDNIETNSRTWSIKHTGQVYRNTNRENVAANTLDSSSAKSPYNSPAQDYGIGTTCVRSKHAYTKWWFKKAEASDWTDGITLTELYGQIDLADGYQPNRYDNPDYREWTETVTYSWCKDSNYQDCTKGTPGCSCGSQTVEEPRNNGKPKYLWHYGEVCGDGTKNWYDFNGSNLVSGDWGETNDNSLLLINDTDNDDKVTIPSKCSSMVANSTYPWTNTGAGVSSGSGRSWNTVCSSVTRWRRHFRFDKGNTEFKADTGIRSGGATTSRDEGYVLDTTNSNGEFTITIGYITERKETTNVKDPGADRYTVRNSWSSYESIAAADGSNRTYSINGNYNITHSYPDFTTNGPGDTSERRWQTVTGTLYYGQTVRVCGNIHFGEWLRELDDGSEIENYADKNVGCITVKRDVQNCGNVVGAGNDGYNFSHMYGYNVARIGVQNSALSQNYFYTVWDKQQSHTTGLALTNKEIWARPGDTVQYKIDYCMGANYAHAVHEANGINDGGVDTTMHVEGDSSGKTIYKDTTDRISADKRSNYLFGDTLGKYNNGKTTPIIFNFIKRDNDGRIKEAESIRDDNNIGTKKSPEGVGTIYSCPIGGITTSGTTDHYQIAGKVKNKNGNYSVSAHGTAEQYAIDGCESNRTQSLDVGRTLSEKLIWTDMSFTGDVYHANVNGDYLSNAYIRVPYNYTAKPYVTTNNSPKGTVQIGGKMTTTPGIAVFPRKNCAFITDGATIATKDTCQSSNNQNATYATVTKPTTVEIKAYINTESRTFQTDTFVVRANTKSNRNGSAAGGTYATANLNGGGTKLDNDYVVDVPNNVNPGDKVCVKMTITPADSHNYPGNTEVYGASPLGVASESTTPTDVAKHYWALREDGTSTATAVSCSTAVKRPTISVEDSNLYSASNITTSVVSRNNYVYNGGNARNAGNLDYYLFGSWSEYGIFGKVTTGSDGSVNISTLGTASGASLGYSQSSYLGSHKTSVTGYNAQPLTVVTYNGGPKNGTYEYNYSRITHNSSQTRIVYEYETKEDGSRYYRLASKTNQTIAPSSYTFANSPIVNAADSRGVASKATKVCTHSTQTFANVDCDDGKIGSDKIGADAVDVFTTNILDRYGDAKMPYTKTDGAENINGYTNLTETSAAAEQLDGDEGAAMFKNIKGKAFLGYKDGHAVDYDSLAVKNNGNVEGADTNLTAKSVMVYKADTVVINSSLIANNDEKTGSGDFRMPIIIANKVWFTGNPTRIDAIIIAKEELNTCKWNSYNDFLNNVLPSFPTKKDGLASNKANEMSSNICNNELRFTAPVVVKGKVIFNRTYGAGGADNGGDQMRRAEIFELNAATYLWSFAEMSRYSQAITTYSRELPSRY